VGVPGEICIGGAGLARGYLNRPDLTAEKFIANPFDKTGRVYKTGDIGKWLADGNIEYIGRTDDQVKIRGYRIEPGEIETVLMQHESVAQAVVIAKEHTDGNKQLIAYVVPNGTFDKNEVLSWLPGKLPAYMIPSVWMELAGMPLTPNGKIDKKALPVPDKVMHVSDEYVAPRNEMERVLVEIWQQLLHVERIGVYDDFFELGGHSLLAMRVLAAIQDEFKVELSVKMLFQLTTIHLIAQYIAVNQSNVLSTPEDYTTIKL
jgi:acyl carrier protein